MGRPGRRQKPLIAGQRVFNARVKWGGGIKIGHHKINDQKRRARAKGKAAIKGPGVILNEIGIGLGHYITPAT
jgi:hypothetical protein